MTVTKTVTSQQSKKNRGLVDECDECETRSAGSRFKRRHTQPVVDGEPGRDVYAMTEWNLRTANITDDSGKVIFEQKGIEAPVSWSDLAVNIVASKYFRGSPGTPERETSIRALISRVASTISQWGREDGYFAGDDAATFEDELTWLLLNQHACFNSPVWFNVGTTPRPQCSACFINSVEDSMESILTLTKTEGMLFKHGSGTGTNFSTLRSSKEFVRGGGLASGPVSFMKGLDAFAGVIKSGGKTRRAAKMAILDVGHPDIVEFIKCKSNEEKKAHSLIDAGYDGSVNGEAYSSIYFQNANHSVRVTDDFMQSWLDDGVWRTRAVKSGEVMETYQAHDLMRKIAGAAHDCGDPGLQFDDAINRWHTCKATDRIHASNPCSEYMFLDDTACNLASINLMKYFDTGTAAFDVDGYRFACEIIFTAQEILVDRASYPTDRIGANSHRFRPLGIGFANLGALFMNLGVPYDSDEARGWCGALTAVLTGSSYVQSARIAASKGSFDGYAENRDSMRDIMRLHRESVEAIVRPTGLEKWRRDAMDRLVTSARGVWDEVIELGDRHGYRNAQASVLAPTGTIAFMMDCDTTGIEPDIALVKYKHLSGGGTLKLVNQSVQCALERLGYDEPQVKTILAYINEHETIEGAPYLKDEHLAVFDCAFRPRNGARTISPMGHVRMMAAAQPFLSGAISKTVNLPEDSSVSDIEKIYVAAWKLGLKAVAIYRDGCKRSQPLSTGKMAPEETPMAAIPIASMAKSKPFRRRLPAERYAMTHRFEIQGHEGYITVGMYEDGTPGEIFLKMSKQGSTISGLMDTIATLTSISLQYGVPLQALVRKFAHMRFEPSGFTTNASVPMAKSIVDYTFRWLASKFLSEDDRKELGIQERGDAPTGLQTSWGIVPAAMPCAAVAPEKSRTEESASATIPVKMAFANQSDAPTCSYCGSVMRRNGSCYLCDTCGASNGCS